MRLALAALALLALAALSACGGGEPAPTETDTVTPAATAAVTAEATPTAAAATVTTTPAPTPTAMPTPTPTAVQAPTATPTTSPSTFRYDALDVSGAVAGPGAYAFLAADGAVVTTYEGLRDGSTVGLRIHETDADGVSRAAFYAGVEAGDVFEWRERDDCWVRYQVTSVAPPISGVKRLGVASMTYAFTGCSGAIAAGTAFTLNPGPLPDLGGFDLAYPIRHGPYQLTPKDWTGATEPETSHEPPGWNEANPVYTSDLATAQKLPYWRDPKLPEGWRFLSAGTNLRVLYGYCASWANADGYGGVDICGFYSSVRAWPSARRGPYVVYETRMIEGRPAMVRYSPASLEEHSPGVAIKLWIYDAATESEYTILGADSSLRGSSVDAVIAIARSLFAEPGAYAFLAADGAVVTTYEGLRDGSTVGLRVHETDADGVSHAAFYASVGVGDVFEWRERDDCWVRYQVTSAPSTAATGVKRLGVEWMTYAFTGCSGAIATGTAFTLNPGPLPDLGGVDLTVPVRHGVFQLVPESWTGAIDPGETYELPEDAPPHPGPYVRTQDLSAARDFPYWRDPALPADWTFGHAFTGGADVSHGYCAYYYGSDGHLNVEICGTALWGTGAKRLNASGRTSDGTIEYVRETRWISGRPAAIEYSPEGPLHDRSMSVKVWVHDVATQSIYEVIGVDPSLRGANVDAVIAIAESLFAPPNAP